MDRNIHVVYEECDCVSDVATSCGYSSCKLNLLSSAVEELGNVVSLEFAYPSLVQCLCLQHISVFNSVPLLSLLPHPRLVTFAINGNHSFKTLSMNLVQGHVSPCYFLIECFVTSIAGCAT